MGGDRGARRARRSLMRVIGRPFERGLSLVHGRLRVAWGRVGLAALSGALYTVSFPPYHQAWCAWVALVPLLLALRHASFGAAIGLGYVTGLVAFGWTCAWLRYVSVSGWLVLAAYLAVYVALFAALVRLAERVVLRATAAPRPSWLPPWSRPALQWLIVPSCWTLCEWLRSWVFTGFGWALLGYSQWRMLPVIQVASVVSAFGVSFLLALTSQAAAITVSDWHDGRRAKRGRPEEERVTQRGAQRGTPGAQRGTRTEEHGRAAELRVMWGALGGCLAVALAFGVWRVGREPSPAAVPFRVAVVQGNIPQDQKWDAEYIDAILQRYIALTKIASREAPDLIIWPETSVPGFLEKEPAMLALVQTLARYADTHLLVGTPSLDLGPVDRQTFDEQIVRQSSISYFNSAVLLGSSGELLERYDKRQLVPFGEYVPFERWIPQIRQWIPPTGDFLPGRTPTVFEVGGVRFGVLICYEDIFPRLVRDLRRRGADFVVNVTNDGWFGDTSGAADQHAQASVFRAVEEGVWVVRAANTGYSCVIDPAGRIVAEVADGSGRRIGVEGIAAATLRLER